MNKLYVGGAVLLILGIVWFVAYGPLQRISSKDVAAAAASNEKPIKIGVVTDMSGDYAFFGASTRAGFELAQKDLEKEGVQLEFIFEDSQNDSTKALSAAQKLINLDDVDGIYDEFNPTVIPISSYLKTIPEKKILNVYDSAPVSPLVGNPPLIYKTYIDYESGCRTVAKYLKEKEHIQSVGVLKANLEFGDLCTKGVVEIFGDDAVVEPYNLGMVDFRTILTRLSKAKVQAVFDVTFPSEFISSLKQARELGIKIPFIVESDGYAPEDAVNSPTLFKNVLVFGIAPIPKSFTDRLSQELPHEKVAYAVAAATGYVHAKQMAHALSRCGHVVECLQNEMDNAQPDSVIGFEGFTDHIARIRAPIMTFRQGVLTPVE